MCAQRLFRHSQYWQPERHDTIGTVSLPLIPSYPGASFSIIGISGEERGQYCEKSRETKRRLQTKRTEVSFAKRLSNHSLKACNANAVLSSDPTTNPQGHEALTP